MYPANTYFTSSVLLSLTCSLGLRNTMDKHASPVLCSAQWEQSEVQKLYCAVEFFSVIEASKLVTVKVESRSQTPSLRVRHHCRLRMHYNITGDRLSYAQLQ